MTQRQRNGSQRGNIAIDAVNAHKSHDNSFSFYSLLWDSLSLSKRVCTRKEIAVGGQGHLTHCKLGPVVKIQYSQN